MPLVPTDDSLAWRGATLAERIARLSSARVDAPAALGNAGDEAAPGATSASLALRLARWRELLSADETQWRGRLAWSGWSEAAASRALDETVPASLPPLDPADQAWLRVVRLAQHVARRSAPHPPALAGERAFAPVLTPFVRVARRLLAAALRRQQAADLAAQLAPTAWQDLERALIGDLGQLADDTLLVLYQSHAAGRAALATSSLGDTRFRGWVAALLADGLASIEARYPVLLRLLADLVLRWVRRIGELLSRWSDDRAVVTQTLFGTATAATIRRIEDGLSDPHHGGRVVAVLHLDDDRKVVYKPRSLGIEAAFFRLLDTLSQGSAALSLRVVRVMDRGTHGWMEFVHASAELDAAGAARWFTRAGELLAVAYAFGATDLHGGNLLADGDDPVLVDLECVMGALVRREGERPDTHAPRRQLWESVLRTSLLPQRLVAAGRSRIEGGFTGAPAGMRAIRQLVAVNRDQMRWERVATAVPAGRNLPSIDREPQQGADWADAITRGFSRGYSQLAAVRAALLAEDGPLDAFRGCHWRVVMRNTQTYLSLSERTRAPRLLESGALRSLEFEVLLKHQCRDHTPPDFWPVWQAEQRALEQLDIPAFTADAAGTALECPGMTPVADALVESGLAGARARLRRLSTHDHHVQEALVRGAFALFDPRTATAAAIRTPPAMATDAPLDDRTALHVAQTIAAQLRALHVVRDDRHTWVGLVQETDARDDRLDAVGDGLFEGTAGIALFFAALAQRTGASDDVALARALVAPWHALVADQDARRAWVAQHGLGLARGAGGVLYALRVSADLLDDEEARRSVRDLASACCDDVDLDDPDLPLELLRGLAGFVIGVDRAVPTCAPAPVHRVLGAMRQRLIDPDAWQDTVPWNVRDSGMAHGTAGVAVAAAQLATRLEDPTLLDAVRVAVAFESQCWSRQHGNWYDTPVSAAPRTTAPWRSWCHGAAGIGLARLELLRRVGRLAAPRERAAWRRDVARSLCAVQTGDEPAPLEQYCCGELGRIEVLLEAERAGRVPSGAAQRWLGPIAARGVQRGGFLTGLPNELTPGFFQGISGIGYAMLRAIAPSDVPSVLAVQ